MKFEYDTNGTCSSHITFDLDEGVVRNIEFTNGCNGNLKAISAILEGAKATEVIEKLLGNTCGYKNTSCADQLARAIKIASESENI